MPMHVNKTNPVIAANDLDRPLRILHLTVASDAGGLSRYIFDLASAMCALGHQVAVAGDRGAWHWLFETAPFPWIDVPFNSGPFALGKCARILNQYLDQNPVDLMHVHYRRCTLVARRVQRAHPIPILYTLHLSHIAMSWMRRRFTDFGDHTHVAAEEARQWLIQSGGVPDERISIIPHGVDPQRFPAADEPTKIAAKIALGLKPDDLMAAYVGRMDTPKNEEWMLDLAVTSRTRLPNLKILLVGQGPHEAMLRERIHREKLADRVILLGHRDPQPIYQAADALLLPSEREGFSLVCAEAMSTGVPVLRTRTAGASALIVENVTGRSVPINHDDFLAAAIEFLSDPINLKRMGNLAAKHIRDHFTFERQLNDTIDLYRSLIRLRPSKK
jgi:glycosyltransferase involved in cell wall biosynthesis